jgi:uncharacterized membrane protein
MARFTWKIHQLRGFFVVYTLVRLGVETILGWGVTRDMSVKGTYYEFTRWLTSPGILLIMIILITAFILVIVLWLFSNLLQKKNWARILLLVIGWLTVVDAISGLLFTARGSNFIPWVTELVPGLDWQRIMFIDRIKDILGLLFWGYLIVVLQFDPKIKGEFFPPAGSDPESE